MVISWVDSDGKTGLAEDSYEFAMQHQAIEAQTIGGVVPRREASPQERINESFNEIPRKRFDDQNNPMVWGLGEINQNIENLNNPENRQQNELEEINSGIARTPLERQAQARRSGAEDSADVSTYDHPDADRYFRNLMHEKYMQFKKQPLTGSLKNLTEQEFKDLYWDTPIVSNKGGEASAADIQEMLDVTDEEHQAHYDEAVKALGSAGSVIGGVSPSGRIRMRKDSPGAQEYLKNLPPDVSAHDLGDGYILFRKKPGDKPPVVGSVDDSLNAFAQEVNRDDEVDARQARLGEMLHDLRVRITGDPEKWATKEHIGDFVDKAMSVMGGGIRRPPGGPRGLGRGLSSSIGEERIQSAAMKVGDKIYEGENHGIAYEKAGDHNPAMAVEEGFTTNKGRFVSREEAAGIAKKQEQVLLEARQTENLHSGELKYGFERVPQSEQEPPLKKGFTRLYRAETSTLPGEKAAHVSEWIADSSEYQSMLQSSGRWFTNSKEAANYYMSNQGGKSISHVDVPTKDVEGYRASNHPEAKKYIASGRENEEFFLPSELASSRKPLVQPPKEPSKEQWSKYMELSSQGKTTKQIIKATKMDPEVVRDALGRDNLALAAFNSENALTEAYFNQLKTMPPELEKALRAKGVSVKDLKTFTRSLPEEDLAHIFQQLPENVKTWWQAGELRRQKIDEGKKASMIPKGSKPLKE